MDIQPLASENFLSFVNLASVYVWSPARVSVPGTGAEPMMLKARAATRVGGSCLDSVVNSGEWGFA